MTTYSLDRSMRLLARHSGSISKLVEALFLVLLHCSAGQRSGVCFRSRLERVRRALSVCCVTQFASVDSSCLCTLVLGLQVFRPKAGTASCTLQDTEFSCLMPSMDIAGGGSPPVGLSL